MSKLAWRNLSHDKVRFGVTLTGIVFAIVLIIVQIGLFLGFTTTTSNNIDHSNVDLWMVSKGVTYFDGGAAFSERKLYQALATPGVESASKQIVEFVPWQKPDGGKEVVIITGFDLERGLGGPWSLAEGSFRDLRVGGHHLHRRVLSREARGLGCGRNGRDQWKESSRRRIYPRHPLFHHFSLRVHLFQERPQLCRAMRSPRRRSS